MGGPCNCSDGMVDTVFVGSKGKRLTALVDCGDQVLEKWELHKFAPPLKKRKIRSTPLVIEEIGTVFVGNEGNGLRSGVFYAIDAETAQVKWLHEMKYDNKADRCAENVPSGTGGPVPIPFGTVEGADETGCVTGLDPGDPRVRLYASAWASSMAPAGRISWENLEIRTGDDWEDCAGGCDGWVDVVPGPNRIEITATEDGTKRAGRSRLTVCYEPAGCPGTCAP